MERHILLAILLSCLLRTSSTLQLASGTQDEASLSGLTDLTTAKNITHEKTFHSGLTGLNILNGLVVKVDEGSQAHKLGVEVGWRVLRVDASWKTINSRHFPDTIVEDTAKFIFGETFGQDTAKVIFEEQCAAMWGLVWEIHGCAVDQKPLDENGEYDPNGEWVEWTLKRDSYDSCKVIIKGVGIECPGCGHGFHGIGTTYGEFNGTILNNVLSWSGSNRTARVFASKHERSLTWDNGDIWKSTGFCMK